MYYIKKTPSNLFSYSNINLGEITSVDITDSSKIFIFYKDFLTAEILNNSLIKFDKIEFLNLNVTFLRKATNYYFWIYSDVSQKIFLYDYRIKRILSESKILQKKEIKKMTYLTLILFIYDHKCGYFEK